MQRGHLMQMAQRKRQHEREEASEQEGEDEEYSEEEEEEYFEEGEEEERSFDPEEEASEIDDSREWKRRSRTKRKSFKRPRQARKAKRQPVAASPRRSESREPSAKRHQPLAVRKPKAVLRPQQPKYPPPPPPPPPPPYTPGFWFGHTHRMDITGPAVAGRWIHAKNQVWQEGEWSRPLPKLFRAGGHLSRFIIPHPILSVNPPASHSRPFDVHPVRMAKPKAWGTWRWWRRRRRPEPGV